MSWSSLRIKKHWESRSTQWSSLKIQERATVSPTNTGTVLNVTLGKCLRDGVGCTDTVIPQVLINNPQHEWNHHMDSRFLGVLWRYLAACFTQMGSWVRCWLNSACHLPVWWVALDCMFQCLRWKQKVCLTHVFMTACKRPIGSWKVKECGISFSDCLSGTIMGLWKPRLYYYFFRQLDMANEGVWTDPWHRNFAFQIFHFFMTKMIQISSVHVGKSPNSLGSLYLNETNSKKKKKKRKQRKKEEKKSVGCVHFILCYLCTDWCCRFNIQGAFWDEHFFINKSLVDLKRL